MKTNKTVPHQPPATSHLQPSFTPCTVCRYQWRGQCRLNPPSMAGGWSVYPNVANDPTHGCFQGKAK